MTGNDQEGIALVPDCATGDARVFIAEDSQEVWRYEGYPVACIPPPIPSLSPWGLALLIAALLQAGAARPSAVEARPTSRGISRRTR